MNIAQELLKITMQAVVTIAANKKIEYNKEEILKKMQETYKEKIAAILEEVQKDAKQADLFGGLERGNVHSLVKTVGIVSMRHGCVMYAKELLGLPADETKTETV
jgi:hypothetical protein